MPPFLTLTQGFAKAPGPPPFSPDCFFSPHTICQIIHTKPSERLSRLFFSPRALPVLKVAPNMMEIYTPRDWFPFLNLLPPPPFSFLRLDTPKDIILPQPVPLSVQSALTRTPDSPNRIRVLRSPFAFPRLSHTHRTTLFPVDFFPFITPYVFFSLAFRFFPPHAHKHQGLPGCHQGTLPPSSAPLLLAFSSTVR